MSAGLPGLGLGGLFFILSALLAPLFELVRTARGQSSSERWRQVARQFALAVMMIAAVELTLRGVYLALSAAGTGGERIGVTALPIAPIAVTGALLGAVLIAAKCVELALRTRPVGRPRALRLPASRWALAGLAVIAVGSIGVIAFGASGNGPLPNLKARDTDPHLPPGGERSPMAAATPASLGKHPRVGGRATHESTDDGGFASDGAQGRTPLPSQQTSHDAGTPESAGGGSPMPPGATPAPIEVPPDGGVPPPVPEAPGGPGPPPTAGPPVHSQAPTSAGPPAAAGPARAAGPPGNAGGPGAG